MDQFLEHKVVQVSFSERHQPLRVLRSTDDGMMVWFPIPTPSWAAAREEEAKEATAMRAKPIIFTVFP